MESQAGKGGPDGVRWKRESSQGEGRKGWGRDGMDGGGEDSTFLH